MREIIKSDTRFPFVPNAPRFLLLSGVLVLASIVLLAVRGLNLGIDFKGGTKLIVGVDRSAGADADTIRKAIADLIEKKTGQPAGQIEVQEFDVGATDEKAEFQIYTELTTLLTPEAQKRIEDRIRQKLPVKTIDRPPETDKFIVVLQEKKPVSATKQAILELLHDMGYTHAAVVSEEERSIDMEFYKEYNLSVRERMKEGKPIPDDDFENASKAHEERKRKLLEKRLDDTYTVSLQQIQTDVEEALVAAIGPGKVHVESSTAVSPSVGRDLFDKGLLAMIYAVIGILIYIGLRFDFRYSPGAVIALVHDSLITLGVFSAFGIKFTLPIISALLTIIGYSLNDTIVVYDRIRENQRERLRTLDLPEIVNRSINETLSRTLLTSLTTLIVVLALLFLGGGLIRDFALALAVGIVVGTYSSIFIASPIVILLQRYFEARRARAMQSARATT